MSANLAEARTNQSAAKSAATEQGVKSQLDDALRLCEDCEKTRNYWASLQAEAQGLATGYGNNKDAAAAALVRAIAALDALIAGL